ncbi:dTDP-4-keto-6-deoxy-D-glucose epimerase [Nonomuraea phyllanthi]|uniref:dTDP-4-keto-6-deoxy-D-glucose epimerase n=1 Tax=Nonomuraea phyllanthi TaxID=2219224 RepID=A0A5C4W045_9ACTN|nr:dTDP-4-dehydrorhamnose 3,5-epimerase family protein [Nonomuraea phyllanthi]KAB8190959.1 dTDP-4-keto-6-deoxy-D-glucose epimerase [Nonomuraea phyllanthi]QFY11954.1 dTDP-4-keto-6-deoxy-D-glucose epimerase [Nonomuraea phyllanthi]
MDHRELGVAGAYAFFPEVFPDERGDFASPYQETAFAAAVGRRLFPVAQASRSVSRRGVVRGVHYTLVPPGTAKYVTCAGGRALDYVIDLRIGSPTFGRWESLELTAANGVAVYLPPGVGHAFAALEDDTVVCYLLSEEYQKEHELALSVFDGELGLRLPPGPPVLSERDRRAPTLAEAAAQGLLPRYDG